MANVYVNGETGITLPQTKLGDTVIHLSLVEKSTLFNLLQDYTSNISPTEFRKKFALDLASKLLNAE